MPLCFVSNKSNTYKGVKTERNKFKNFQKNYNKFSSNLRV